jgi:hypothetical protein
MRYSTGKESSQNARKHKNSVTSVGKKTTAQGNRCTGWTGIAEVRQGLQFEQSDQPGFWGMSMDQRDPAHHTC